MISDAKEKRTVADSRRAPVYRPDIDKHAMKSLRRIAYLAADLDALICVLHKEAG